MEAATAKEVALGPTLKMQEASPADAEEPQTSPQQRASSPIPQLLAPLEGSAVGPGPTPTPSLAPTGNPQLSEFDCCGSGALLGDACGLCEPLSKEAFSSPEVGCPFFASSLQPQSTDCSAQSQVDAGGQHPKIWLPRALRQTYIRKVGDTVNLLVPFQGKPKPQATWTHNGCALDANRVSVRNGDRDSILFIREAQRADSGCYQLSVQSGGLEATVTIDVLVIERPGPPQSIKLVDVWGSNATLEWTPPQDTGNVALLGYTVQKADTKSGLWFTVLEHYHRTDCIISNLIVGNSYTFRVFAENQCGLSETAPITADLAHIQKAATVYKIKEFVQRDFSEAPKFTQPLVDCTTVTGYDTQLFCCVRASPKPKITWLKNKMDIQGNPKYRALTQLGICSLEIRKPGPFDGGIYTCKAVNPLGEASVDCRVDVIASL